MELIKYLDLFFGSLFSILANALIIKKLYGLEFKKGKAFIFIIATIIVSFINIYNRDLFKVLIILPILSICFKYIFDLEIQKSLTYVMLATFYLFLGEIITGLMFSLLPVNYSFIYNNVLGGTIGSIVVIIFTIPFVYVSRLSNLLKNIFNVLNKNNISLVLLIFAMLIGAFTYRNTHVVESKIALIVNAIILLVFGIISYLYFKQVHKAERIKRDYDTLLNYLERYEKELDKKRKIVHEFNNQLIVINSYASKNNKKLKLYLSEIINDQKGINNDMLLNNIENLPNGIRGLLYYKLSQIEDKLKLNFFVDKNIKKVKISSSKKLKNVLKVIGILLDNAIEASLESNEKNLIIRIELKKDFVELYIENSIKNKIESTKIYDKGFTTKEKGRGYGLSIAKDILNEEQSIELKNVVSDKFVSILKVKI